MTAISIYMWLTAGMYIISAISLVSEHRCRSNKIATGLSVVMSIFGIVCVNLLDRI